METARRRSFRRCVSGSATNMGLKIICTFRCSDATSPRESLAYRTLEGDLPCRRQQVPARGARGWTASPRFADQAQGLACARSKVMPSTAFTWPWRAGRTTGSAPAPFIGNDCATRPSGQAKQRSARCARSRGGRSRRVPSRWSGCAARMFDSGRDPAQRTNGAGCRRGARSRVWNGQYLPESRAASSASAPTPREGRRRISFDVARRRDPGLVGETGVASPRPRASARHLLRRQADHLPGYDYARLSRGTSASMQRNVK